MVVGLNYRRGYHNTGKADYKQGVKTLLKPQGKTPVSFIEETFEGIALRGTEVKSIREEERT